MLVGFFGGAMRKMAMICKIKSTRDNNLIAAQGLDATREDLDR